MICCDNNVSQKGVPQLGRYTLEDLKEHKTQEDAWTAIQGKVYNITPYLKFHPGGVKDLMRCAGKDGTRLFSKLTYFHKRNSVS
jgi:cytochrome b involved in lipid metabolism